jgi:cytoskeleton protein RodZ
MSQDFGSYLKHERELRGVPLDDIAQSTKISIRFLRALEEGRFEDLPGEVFIKGFIRSYGQAIGSNVDELMAAYHESSSTSQLSGASDIAAPPSKNEPPKSSIGFPMQAVVGFGTALLIIIGGFYWFTSQKGENSGKSQQAQSTTPTVTDNNLSEVEAPASEAASGFPPAEADQILTEAGGSTETPAKVRPEKTSPETPKALEPIKNTVTVPEKDAIIKDFKDQIIPESMEPVAEIAMGEASLNLVIQVSENSWFNLRIDDQRDQDFILPPGGSKTIRAKNAIVMTIGNRQATQMILNGQQMDLPESPDNVIRNLTLNAEQLN